MINLAALVLSLLLASTSLAAPARHDSWPPIPVTAKGLLCRLPIPVVQRVLCPRQGDSDPTVNTPIGAAHGVVGDNNVARYAVRYGQAARWQPSSAVTSWQFPYVSCSAFMFDLS